MTDTAKADSGMSVGELDRLVTSLETIAKAVDESRPKDAIDDVLAGPRRTTAVVSLRDAPEVEAFRQALTDGLIRVDTVNQLLRLVNEVVGLLVR